MVLGREIGVTKRQIEESDVVVPEPYDEVSFFERANVFDDVFMLLITF